MPRMARRKTQTNIYHVILRGNNKQIIFEDDKDYEEFLDVLMYYKRECGFELYAYCLMNNHVHLCIGKEMDELEIIMKRIEVKYVRWYNTKYDRCGHLFQERFKSEPVEEEKYFLTLIRYIHQNPIKSGLEGELGSYRWSSYQDYMTGDSEHIDLERILSYFGDLNKFQKYMKCKSEDQCMEYYAKTRVPDEEAIMIVKDITGLDSLNEIVKHTTLRRNKWIVEMKKRNLSIRQISRLTGVSKAVIEKAIKLSA